MNGTPTTHSAALADPEREWLEKVYQRGARQLTVRAVIAGMLIGAVMCLSNLYVVIKTGWSIGVTITACIVAYAGFGSLKRLKLSRKEFTPLENNAMGSVASAAGYMTGGGNMAALPALLLLTGMRPDTVPMILWFMTISMLGVFAAIPIKRQLVNIEQLPFPTGTATAATIRALHSHGGEGSRQGRLLFGSGAISGLLEFLTSWKILPVDKVPLFGAKAAQWTFSMPLGVLLIGAGMLISLRTGWSLLLGGIVAMGVLAPWMHDLGAIPTIGFKSIIEWTVWLGAGILVSSGILAFAFQWKSVAKSFSELAGVLRPKKKGQQTPEDPMAEVESPTWWTPAGFIVLGPIIVALGQYLFGIPWWMGALSLPLAFVMGIIASRVTGETDFTPTKALGPVTQMIYGAALPGNITANIMGANVTGGVGLHAADLLTDLKSGYLLGANPRQQFYAQMFGCVAGAAVVVPAFNLIIPSVDLLGTPDFPVPAAQVWAGVSKVLVAGVGALHPTARVAGLIGLAVGAVLAGLERYGPKKLLPFVPSPGGLGIGMIIPAYNSIAFFLGALIAAALKRYRPKLADEATLPVGSGFIAGASLVGVAVAMLIAFGYGPK